MNWRRTNWPWRTRSSRERGAYGETILKVLEGLSERSPLPGLVGIGESKAQIGERIRMIARGSVGPRGRWAACALAAVIAGIALTSARDEQPEQGHGSAEEISDDLDCGRR